MVHQLTAQNNIYLGCNIRFQPFAGYGHQADKYRRKYQADSQHGQGCNPLLTYNLVNNHLSKYWCHNPQKLQQKGSQHHFSQTASIAVQHWQKPAKAKIPGYTMER